MMSNGPRLCPTWSSRLCSTRTRTTVNSSMSTYVTTSRRSSGKPIHEHLSIPTAPFLVRNFEHSPRPFLPAFSSGLGRLLEAGELTDTSLLANFQILPRVASGPTFQKGLYCGGALPGALQGLSLLENYFLRRLRRPPWLLRSPRRFASASVPVLSLTSHFYLALRSTS